MPAKKKKLLKKTNRHKKLGQANKQKTVPYGFNLLTPKAAQPSTIE